MSEEQQNNPQIGSGQAQQSSKTKKQNDRLRSVFFFDNLPKEFFTLMKTVVKDKYFAHLLSDDPYFKSSEFRLRLSLHVPQKLGTEANLYHVKVISDELEKMTKLSRSQPFHSKLESHFLFDPYDTTNSYNNQFHNSMTPSIQELKSSFLDTSIHTQLNFYIMDKASPQSNMVCIEADDNFFPNILEKTKKYQSTPKSLWEIIGEIYVCGEFILRIGEVQFQNRPSGYTVDIEYIPCIMIDSTHKMLKQFTENLFDKTKDEYEKETKAKIDWKSRLQTTFERDQYYVQYAIALAKRKETLSILMKKQQSKDGSSSVGTPIKEETINTKQNL